MLEIAIDTVVPLIRIIERLFNEQHYYEAYRAGTQHTPMPTLQPRVRILPRYYRSSYRYTTEDLLFAYWEGFRGNPKPKPKVWK
jgi:hypothetical protein